jgi:hypothetical protein
MTNRQAGYSYKLTDEAAFASRPPTRFALSEWKPWPPCPPDMWPGFLVFRARCLEGANEGHSWLVANWIGEVTITTTYRSLTANVFDRGGNSFIFSSSFGCTIGVTSSPYPTCNDPVQIAKTSLVTNRLAIMVFACRLNRHARITRKSPHPVKRAPTCRNVINRQNSRVKIK